MTEGLLSFPWSRTLFHVGSTGVLVWPAVPEVVQFQF